MKPKKTKIIIDRETVLSYAMKANHKEKDWYLETRQTIVEIFGESEAWFVCQLLASTSINSALRSNVSLFAKAYVELKTGKPFSGYIPVMLNQLERLRNGQPISGRKISNFARAMFGDDQAVVVDLWIMRAFGLDTRRKLKTGRFGNWTPSKTQYDTIENWIIETAPELGLKPRELCSMIWSGIRTTQTSKDNPTRYCDLLRQRFTTPLFGKLNILK